MIYRTITVEIACDHGIFSKQFTFGHTEHNDHTVIADLTNDIRAVRDDHQQRMDHCSCPGVLHVTAYDWDHGDPS